MSLGSAFQKVNFLRDLKHDNEDLHRIYFPHLHGAELNQENKSQSLKRLKMILKKLIPEYRNCPNEAKFGVYTAYIYYMKLLQKLKKANAREIREERIRINNPTKIKLLVSSYVNYKLKLI